MWNLRVGSPRVVTRTAPSRRPPRYFQPPKAAPASSRSTTTAVGNFAFGFSDAGAESAGWYGIGCAPEAVRAIGGTVRERFADPPPVDPPAERDPERWLPVRGAGAP